MMRALLPILFFLGCEAHAISDQRFMPENELYKFDTMDKPSNITEDAFEEVLGKIESYYKPLIKKLYSAEFQVIRDWEDPTVNAYATQMGDTWEIHMYGGLARRPEITPDGFALVACHETGHHLGGYPLVTDWAADEGQSDYFSTLSCARKIWKGDPLNKQALKKIPSYPKQKCDQAWHTTDEQVLCYRMALAGKSLSDLLSGGTAKFETPSKQVVTETDHQHPQGQCRLDTYLAGALCKVSFDDRSIPKTSDKAFKVSCIEKRDLMGFRPRCWFKPSEIH